MPARTAAEEWRQELICVGVLAVAFVLLATLSWRTWPDILVDFGQEVYVPWRITEGEVLYRDIAWVTGPFSQYVNGALFKLFGVSLTTLTFANLTILAGIVALLYWLLRQIGNRWTATSTCLFFLVVFAFAQYSVIGNYNYICPYRHDITHGLLLGLINLVCLIHFGRSGRVMWLLASGLCLGLLSLTKIEMTLAACLVTGVALILFAWQGVVGLQSKLTESTTDNPAPPRLSRWFKGLCASRSNSKQVQKPVAHPRIGGGDWMQVLKTIQAVLYWSGLVGLAALVPILIVVAAFAISLGWLAAFKSIFLQYLLALSPEKSGGAAFYRAISGMDDPAGHLLGIAFASIMVFAALIAAYVVSGLVGQSRRAGIWSILLGLGTAYVGFTFVPQPEWHGLVVSLPVWLGVIALYSLRSTLQDPRGSHSILFLLSIYGLGLLPKILLRVSWKHYGFVLAMPGTLVLLHCCLELIPGWWANLPGRAKCFRSVMAGLFTACALSLALSWIRIYANKRVIVGEGGDQFYAVPNIDGRTIPTVTMLAYLKENMRPDDSLIVFPNGVMLNYLLRKPNPTPYIMFNPWESDVHGGEDAIADKVIRSAPDYAVVVSMDLSVHGKGDFGSPEFGGRIAEFLIKNYDVVDRQVSEGGFDGPFQSTVFRRRQ